jgi:carbon-monoxide dehydrogenase medium subunit
MELPDFVYHRPATLVDACDLGKTYGSKGRYLAGGTEVLVDLRQRRFCTEHVISLTSVPDLNSIQATGGGLRIGAMVTLTEVAESSAVRQAFPTLCDAILHIGSEQIRNQATIGGNICGAVPCADTPPICIAGAAELRLAGPSGERNVPLRDFFVGPRESVLLPGELLVQIVIPTQPGHSGTSYQRFSLRHGSALAVASVAARLVVDGARIADAGVVLGAVAPIPLPAASCVALLQGNEPSEELLALAGAAAAQEAQPISDIRGSEAFRRHLVQVLTVRAVHEAFERARRTPS